MLVQLAGYMKEAVQRQSVPKLRLRLLFRLTNPLVTSTSHTASVHVLRVIKIAPLYVRWAIYARSHMLTFKINSRTLTDILNDRHTLRIAFIVRNGWDFKSRCTIKTWDNRKFA